MKTLYKILVVGFLHLIISNLSAQDIIISPSSELITPYPINGDKDQILLPLPPRPPVDEDEDNAFEVSCQCQYYYNYFGIQNDLQATSNEQLWFEGMERAQKYEMEQRLGKTFPTHYAAQKAFFSRIAERWHTGPYYNQIGDYVSSNFSYSNRKIVETEARYKSISAWQNEYNRIRNGQSRVHKFGDLRYSNPYVNNVKIEDLRHTITLATSKSYELNKLNTELNKKTNTINWRKKLDKAKETKAFENWISQQYLNQYYSLGYRDAIKLMIVYLITDFSGPGSGVIAPPNTFFSNNVYWAGDYNFYDQMVSVTNSQSITSTPATDTNLSSEEAIARYAIKSLPTRVSNLVLGNTYLKSKTSGYLYENEYSAKSLAMANRFFTSYLDNQYFNIDRNLYASAWGASPRYQNENQQYLALRAVTSTGQAREGMTNLTNLFNPTYLQGQNYDHEGYNVRAVFLANGLQIPDYITNEMLGRTFNFIPQISSVIQIYFEYGIGEQLWANGYSLQEFLNSPFAQQAALALINEGKVDFDDQVILDSSFLSTKAYCVYNELKRTNGNLFRQTIGSFIDDPKYNLKFVVGECIRTDQACTDGTSSINEGLITIKLENTNINSLEAAALLLHEGLHAEMFRFVKQFHDGEVDTEDKVRLINLYGIYKQLGWDNNEIPTLAQHTYMTENYIIPIAKAVRELDGNRFPLNDYLGYGWDGLKRIAHPSLISDEQFQDLLNIKNRINSSTTFNPMNCN
ncbi:hypothetical protein [uncultured Aquimarina sp.]|uniref:hypothetical protein n=1 Tax=uncultured Aquimarina sp. TaxID=575652 RepID=UPI00262048EB|nr:hypothetical protein [uncultured Aquimarina sp.]